MRRLAWAMGLWPHQAQLWAAVARYGVDGRSRLRRRLETWHHACLQGVMAVWHARCGVMDAWLRAHGVARWMRRADSRTLAQLQQAVDRELQRRGVPFGVGAPLPADGRRASAGNDSSRSGMAAADGRRSTTSSPSPPPSSSQAVPALDEAVVAARVAAVGQMIRQERRTVEAALAAAGAADRAHQRQVRQSEAMQCASWRRTSPSTRRLRLQRRSQHASTNDESAGPRNGGNEAGSSDGTPVTSASSPLSPVPARGRTRADRLAERIRRGAAVLVRAQWSDWLDYARRCHRQQLVTGAAAQASDSSGRTSASGDADDRTIRPP